MSSLESIGNLVPSDIRIENLTEARSNFQPFVPAQKNVPELTVKSIVLGVFFALLFATSSVYLALCAGITVGGSIPTAVLVVGIFKRFGKGTILEKNIVQTIGSSGESIAGSSVFTVIALIFLQGGGHYFRYLQLLVLAIVGGLLGLLFMVPLRRSLIVKEHGTLHYPEGTACAEVLMAGETQGDLAKPVFFGSLVAGGYWICMKLLGFWNEIPHLLHRKAQVFFPNATLNIDVTPEYLGIGYIIGPKSTLQMLAGGLVSWLVLVPLFSVYPTLASLLKAHDVSTTLSNLGLSMAGSNGVPIARDIHAAYIKYIALGAVVGAGVITLIRTIPVIVGSFRNVIDTLRIGKIKAQLRTDKEMPMWIVVGGAGILVFLIAVLPQFPGSFPSSLLVSVLIVLFGFFFVTVSSRFVGVAGYTVEPTSSMMFTTVMATCLILLLLGWTSDKYQVMAVLIGAVVCIAAANAGATSQDLKTGYLLGATPYKQQIGLFIGALLSALVVGGTILLIDHSIPGVPHAIGYVLPGQDTPKFAAPQATLLAMLIKAVLGGKMAWGLVLIGVGLSVIVELSGATALSIAVGMYLPLSTTSALFCGALVRWIATRKQTQKSSIQPQESNKDPELRRGMLYATGLVAGGAIAGMLIGFLYGFFPAEAKRIDLGHEYWKSLEPWGNIIPLFAFFLLGITLYHYARKDR